MIPPNTPTIIIYNSAVVHSHHLALLSTDQTQCHITCNVLPSISKSLSHQLQQAINHHTAPLSPSYPTINNAYPLIDKKIYTLTSLPTFNETWESITHIYHIGSITCVNIKSYQLTILGHIRSSSQPWPYLNLAHANYWADQTAELLNSEDNS